MLYKIKEVTEQTTQTGKTYKRAVIVSPEGVEAQVSVWSDFPLYSSVIANSSVEGVIRDNGKYKNLVSGNLGAKPAGMAKTVVMTQMMDKKAGLIEKAQDNKELGIKLSSTIRMATDVAIAEGKPTEENIKKWRAWFWSAWDAKDDDFDAF